MMLGLLLVVVDVLFASMGQHSAVYMTQRKYPPVRHSNQVDDYHGTLVPDPYRWLENVASRETRVWIKMQNYLTEEFLGDIRERDAIRKRLTKVWDYEKYTAPVKEGGKYFYLYNSGLQNQYVLYVADSIDSRARVLLDPNKLSKDGTIALTSWAVSDNGEYLAYALSYGGSDWKEWRVREVATGKDLPDVIKWSKFSDASWTGDSKGFFYSRYDEPKKGEELQGANYYHKLYYHRLGTSQKDDVLVYERRDQKEWGFDGHVTDDGRYLIISVWEGTETKNRVFFADLSRQPLGVVELLKERDASYRFIDNDGGVFLFYTDKDAPRGKVVAIDTANPEPGKWKTVIAETTETLRFVTSVGGKLIANYLKDARSVVKIFGWDGRFEGEINLPGIGTAYGFAGKKNDPETFFEYESFVSPPTIYRYDVVTNNVSLYKQSKVAIDLENYETKQVFYPSKDGTIIPMFISYKKGIKLDGSNPTILYGYGGFGVAITPSFWLSGAVWMEMGGILAVANLRGGSEYGEEWHAAGKRERKQNVFNDFIAAAQYLIRNRYTRQNRLAIYGESNGGLLVGAVLNQRPDLFGAALPGVGVMDMLRFHKFTIGWAWVPEYGSSDDPEDFQTLYAYSPLHNIRPGTRYPAVLITTADHDDRVVPAHSFKYAAALQQAQSGSAPILIRIDVKAGHGMGKPTKKVIDEVTDRFAFLVKVLKMRIPAEYLDNGK